MSKQALPSQVAIYTDGACSGNPGPGGWGALLKIGNHERKLSGFQEEATNNQMELMAVIQALRALNRSCNIIINTDSQYVKKGMTEWIHNWKRNGWKTKAKKPVVNAELWQSLDEEAQKHRIEWRWVKGHSGDTYNEIVDGLATAAIRSRKGVDERQ